ncbi:DUF5668 domain-containing protein [Bacteroidales bacterium OttesenSCG-928-K22]|nr:DUF5668 domain-containing protein [Bacteroidales bacterium OttesenSCG-928-K22]
MFKKIFWSVILILIGILILLRNMQVVYFDFHDLFQLWPFIIIIIGISILPVADWIKACVSLAAVIIALALLFTDTDISFNRNNYRYYRKYNNSQDWRYRDKDKKSSEKDNNEDYTYSEIITDDDTVNIDININTDSLSLNFNPNRKYEPVIIDPKDKDSNTLSFCEEYNRKIKYAEYDMELAAGKFLIGPGQDKNLSCFHNNAGVLNYSLSSVDSKDKVSLSLDLEDNNVEKVDKILPYEISLHTAPVWTFNIEAGASSMFFDGTQLKISEMNITGGAASMDITIGELEEEVNMDISSGVSNLIVRIPENAYCEIHPETALNSRKYVGFRKRNDGVYVVNADKSDVSCSIYIKLEAALSVVRVERY